MRRTFKKTVVGSVIAATATAVLTPGSARADFYETNSFMCSGPYTSGMGTATMTAGVHEHWRGNGSTSDVLVARWTNSRTTPHTSRYHGAGWQTFIVMGNGQISNVSRGCHYIG